MRVVVAPDSFKESIGAIEAAAALAEGLRRGWPALEVVEVPMADGGEGTTAVLLRALGGELRKVPVTGPMGEQVVATVALLEGGRTAVLEMASAAGLSLVPPPRRDVMRASTFGVGELLKAAASLGPRRILVGLGGSATCDGGLGMLQALGVRAEDAEGNPVPPGGRGLCMLRRLQWGDIAERWHEVDLQVAVDVDNPLVGPEGAAPVFAPQKGADEEEVARLAEALERYADILEASCGRPVRHAPGAGAAGGLGAAFLALGARLVPGAQLISDLVGLRGWMRGADLAVTGEGRVDPQTERGKVVRAVAEAAMEEAVPLVLVAGQMADLHFRPEQLGAWAAFSLARGPAHPRELMENAAHLLRWSGEQLAGLIHAGWLGRAGGGERPDVVSAGAVLATEDGRVLMMKDRFGYWTLPKGVVEEGESYLAAALREVREELGLTGRPKAYLGRVRYRFEQDGSPVHKEVIYYLLVLPGPEPPRPAPGEVQEAHWLSWEQALATCGYPSNLDILRQARRFL